MQPDLLIHCLLAYVTQAPRCNRTKAGLRCNRVLGHATDEHGVKMPDGSPATWSTAESDPDLAPHEMREVRLPAPKTTADAKRFWASLPPEVAAAIAETRPMVCREWEHTTVAGLAEVHEMVRRRLDGFAFGTVHAVMAGRGVIHEPDKAFFWRAGFNGEHGGYRATAREAMLDVDSALSRSLHVVLVGGIPDEIPELIPPRVAAIGERPDALENR
jgi:hypothetical protein